MKTFVILLFIGSVTLFLFWIRNASLRKIETPRSSMAVSHSIIRMEGDGDFDFEIVGESFYQDALDTIAGGKTEEGHVLECLATMKREPNNPHDPNAIAVFIKGRKVGHFPRDAAAAFSRVMDNSSQSSFTADAIIVGGWRSDRSEGHYGVKLDLRDQ